MFLYLVANTNHGGLLSNGGSIVLIKFSKFFQTIITITVFQSREAAGKQSHRQTLVQAAGNF